MSYYDPLNFVLVRCRFSPFLLCLLEIFFNPNLFIRETVQSENYDVCIIDMNMIVLIPNTVVIE